MANTSNQKKQDSCLKKLGSLWDSFFWPQNYVIGKIWWLMLLIFIAVLVILLVIILTF